MDIQRTILEQRLEALEKERDDFLRQANVEAGRFAGKIELLRSLLEESKGELTPEKDQAGEQA